MFPNDFRHFLPVALVLFDSAVTGPDDPAGTWNTPVCRLLQVILYYYIILILYYLYYII